MEYKLSDAAEHLGLHKQTVWNYIKSGKLKASKTRNNRWFVSQDEIDKFLGHEKAQLDQGVAIYAHVNTATDLNDLERQVTQLVKFANSRGWRVARVAKEIANSADDPRPLLMSLLNDADNYQYIVVEHQQRLTQLGFTLITRSIDNVYVVNGVDVDVDGISWIARCGIWLSVCVDKIGRVISWPVRVWF